MCTYFLFMGSAQQITQGKLKVFGAQGSILTNNISLTSRIRLWKQACVGP